MLARCLGLTRTRLLAHPERSLRADERRDFERLLKRRLAREPLAYLLGEREFLSLDFAVSPAALIPRPETELLAEFAIAEARRRKAGLGLDLGAGCGALAVALAVNLPSVRIIATDLAPEALALACRNARRHRVDSRLRFLCCDLLTGLRGRFDFIVANLPYVASDDLNNLPPEISRYEPRLALNGGADGLVVLRRLLPHLNDHLAPGGFAALEVGQGQAEAVTRIAASCGLRPLPVLNDGAGIPRVVAMESG